MTTLRQSILGAMGGPMFQPWSPDWWLHRADIAVKGADAALDDRSDWPGRDELKAILGRSATKNGQVPTPAAAVAIQHFVRQNLGDNEGTTKRLGDLGLGFDLNQYYEGGGLRAGLYGAERLVPEATADIGYLAYKSGLPESEQAAFTQDEYEKTLAGDDSTSPLTRGQGALDATGHLLSYFVPGFGQVQAAIDTGDEADKILTRAQDIGLLPAVGEDVRQQAENLNPFQAGLYPEERITRALTATLVAVGAAHGVASMREMYGGIKAKAAAAADPAVAAQAQAVVDAVKSQPATEFLDSAGKPGGAWTKLKSDPGYAHEVVKQMAREAGAQIPGDRANPLLDDRPVSRAAGPTNTTAAPFKEGRAKVADDVRQRMAQQAAEAEQRLAESGVGKTLDPDWEQRKIDKAAGRFDPDAPSPKRFEAVRSRDDVYYALLDKFNLPVEEAAATADLFDAHAQTYADALGLDRREAYGQLVAGIGRSGEIVPESMAPGQATAQTVKWDDPVEGPMTGKRVKTIGNLAGRILVETEGANGPVRMAIEPSTVREGIPAGELKRLVAARESALSVPASVDADALARGGQAEAELPVVRYLEGSSPKGLAHNEAASIDVRTASAGNPRLYAGAKTETRAAAAMADRLMETAVPVSKSRDGKTFKFLGAMEFGGNTHPVELTVTRTPSEGGGTYDLAHVEAGPGKQAERLDSGTVRAGDLVVSRAFRGAHADSAGLGHTSETSPAIPDTTDILGHQTPGDKTSLTQEGRAMVTFLHDGRALVAALKAPDASSFVHEMGHVMRRSLYRMGEAFAPDEVAAVERWAGADGGEWGRAAEEKFAKGFETYLSEGVAPTRRLSAVFEKFKGWMRRIYENVVQSPLADEISGDVQAVFDKLLGKHVEQRQDAAAEAEAAEQKARDQRDYEIATRRHELMDVDPDDPRLDPFGDELDQGLVDDIKNYLGEGPQDKRGAGEIIEDAQNAYMASSEYMKAESAEQLREDLDYIGKKPRSKPRAGKRLKGPEGEPVATIRGTRPSGQHEYHMWAKTDNGWMKRGPITFANIETWPPHLWRELRAFVESQADSDYRIAPRTTEWASGASKPPPESLTAVEFADKEGWPPEGELGWAKTAVPTPVYDAFRRYKLEHLREVMRSDPRFDPEDPMFKGLESFEQAARAGRFAGEEGQSKLRDMARWAAANHEKYEGKVEVLASAVSRKFKLGKAETAKVMGMGEQLRAAPRIVEELLKTGSTAQVKKMLAAEFPDIAKGRQSEAINMATEEAGLPSPQDLRSQWTRFSPDEFDRMVDDLAKLVAPRLERFADSREAHQWVKGYFGVSSKEATKILGRAQETDAAGRIGEVYSSTGRLKDVRGMLAEEFKAIPKNRYPQVIMRGLELTGNEVARAVKVERTPEGETVEVPGKMVVAGDTMTVPQRLVDTIKDWAGRIPRMPYMWSEARLVERLTERDPAMYDWLVGNRERAVTAMRTELAWFRSEMAKVWGDLEDDKGARAAVQKFAERQVVSAGNEIKEYTIADLKAERPQDWQRLADIERWFHGAYDGLLERANDVREAFGREPILRRNDYFTHVADVASVWDKLLGATDMEVHSKAFEGKGKTGFSFRATRNAPDNPFARRREGLRTRYDALKNFETYLRPILSEIHLTEPAVRRRALARVMELNEAAGDLTSAAKYLHDMADDLTGQKHVFDKALDNLLLRSDVSRAVVKGFEKVLSRTGANKVGGNLTTAFSQTIPLAVAPAYMRVDSLAQAALGRAMRMVTGTPDPTAMSPYLTRRYADVRPLGDGLAGTAADVANAPFHFIEENTNRVLWEGLNIDARRAGKSVEESVAYADKMLQRLVPGRLKGEMTPAFRSRAGRVIFQFQYEVGDFLQSLKHDLNWDELKGRKLTRAETFQRAAVMWASLYAFAQAQRALTGQSSAPDVVGAGIDSAKELGRSDIPGWAKATKAAGRLAGEVAGLLPGGNELTAVAVPDQDRRRFIFGDSGAAKFSGTAPLSDSFSLLFDSISKGDPAKFGWQLLTDFGLPYGGGQVRKTAAGIQAAAAGATFDKTGDVKYPVQGADVPKAVLFGVGSTSGAEAFYDRLNQKLDLQQSHTPTSTRHRNRRSY